MKSYIAAIALVSACQLFSNEGAEDQASAVQEKDAVAEIQDTVDFMKKASIVEVASQIAINSNIPLDEVYEISCMICRHKHRTQPEDSQRFTYENIEAIRGEAKKSRNDGLVDSLKTIEDAFHLKPGHAIENGRSACENIEKAMKSYELADALQDRIDHGHVEVVGNGVLLRP